MYGPFRHTYTRKKRRPAGAFYNVMAMYRAHFMTSESFLVTIVSTCLYCMDNQVRIDRRFKPHSKWFPIHVYACACRHTLKLPDQLN